MSVDKLLRVNELVDDTKRSIWYWALAVILPLCFGLAIYEGVRLLLDAVPPAARERAISNVLIRGGVVVLLGPVWYFALHRPRARRRRRANAAGSEPHA